MSTIFEKAFTAFAEATGREQQFIRAYYEETYGDAAKGAAAYDEVQAYFSRVQQNYDALQAYKQTGKSSAKWFEDQLTKLEQNMPQSAALVVNAMQDGHHEQLRAIGVETDDEPFTQSYSGVGKRIATQLTRNVIEQHTYMNMLQTEEQFEALEVKGENPAVVRYFNEQLDSPYDQTFKELGTAALIRVQQTDKIDVLKEKSPTELAAIVDRTYTVAKIGVKIATGDMQPSDATDYLMDRAYAQVETIIHHKAKEVGGNVGATVGAAIGAYFGPVGATVGGVVGRFVGEQAGAVVAKTVTTGLKKVVTYAKEKIGAVANKIGSAISSGVRSLFSWW